MQRLRIPLHLLLVLSSLGCSDTDPGSTEAGLVAANREGWSRAMKDAERKREEVVRGLLRVVEDKDRPPEDVRAALSLAVETGSVTALRYCAEHIVLRARTLGGESMDDILRSKPCSYALIQAGWAAVPALFDWMQERSASSAELEEAARVLSWLSSSTAVRQVLLHERQTRFRSGEFERNANALDEILVRREKESQR